MNTTETSTYKDPFSRFVVISIGIHICLLAFFTLKAVVFPSDPIQIRSAIRVDMVALPEKQAPKAAPTPKPAPTVKVEPKAEPKPQPKPVAKPKPTPKPKVVENKINLNKTKSKQDEALNRLKTMQAIAKLKAQKEEEEKAAAAEQEYKGNVLSEGNSITGLAQIEFDRYLSNVETTIRQNWNLPKWLEDAQLRAQVRVLIDERGYIIKKVIETSSGNESFDDTVLGALEKSSPLPPPPARLKNVLSARGFVLNFPE